MRDYLLTIVATWMTLIGCVGMLYACETRADNNYTPQYEKNINLLFEQARECPAMLAECKDAKYQKLLIDGTECLSCKALALLYLRENSASWEDTIGESEYADTLTEDAMSVLEDAEGI